MKARAFLLILAIITLALAVTTLITLPSRPTLSLSEVVTHSSLLPDRWNTLAVRTSAVAPPYSFGSIRNLRVRWEVSPGVWPYLSQWILEYQLPIAAVAAFSVSIPLADRSEPGIIQYDPVWKYESQYADQTRIRCTDLGTGVPVRPEVCTAWLRYGQYIVEVAISDPPVDEMSFLDTLAIVDDYAGSLLHSRQ